MATPPKKPTTRRTTTRKTTGAAGATKPADKVTGAAGAAATGATGSTGVSKTSTAAKAAKPRATTPRKTGSSAGKPGRVAAAVKSAPHNVAEKAQAKVKRARERSPVGFKTAIAAGIGAVGAVATAALLTLRGSTPKRDHASEPTRDTPPRAPDVRPDPGAKARKAAQADGVDSSDSFAAGIADEGTVPKA